jgi:hypothetical protein
VARISALDVECTLDLRRAAVMVAVVAAHAALVIVMLRSAGHSAEVVDITLFPLPISPEDRLREPVRAQKALISPASEIAPRRAADARGSPTEQHAKSSLRESARSENDTLDDTVAAHTGAASEAAPPIDWYAEIEKSARTLEERERIERGRRSLAGPNQPALSASRQAPACPYERCEPGWGANSGIFESQHSKAGRIEKKPSDLPMTFDGSVNTNGDETILWINDWCYSVIVSADLMRRGETKCVVPLGKRPARGDLFDHMHEGQVPKEHYSDDSWLSFGLSVGGSR